MDPNTRKVIDYFEQINRIPRCSKQEQQVAAWLQQWARERSLTTASDAVGNMDSFDDPTGVTSSLLIRSHIKP